MIRKAKCFNILQKCIWFILKFFDGKLEMMNISILHSYKATRIIFIVRFRKLSRRLSIRILVNLNSKNNSNCPKDLFTERKNDVMIMVVSNKFYFLLLWYWLGFSKLLKIWLSDYLELVPCFCLTCHYVTTVQRFKWVEIVELQRKQIYHHARFEKLRQMNRSHRIDADSNSSECKHFIIFSFLLNAKKWHQQKYKII